MDQADYTFPHRVEESGKAVWSIGLTGLNLYYSPDAVSYTGKDLFTIQYIQNGWSVHIDLSDEQIRALGTICERAAAMAIARSELKRRQDGSVSATT